MRDFDYAFWAGRLYVALVEQAPDSKTAAEYEEALGKADPATAEMFPMVREIVRPRP